MGAPPNVLNLGGYMNSGPGSAPPSNPSYSEQQFGQDMSGYNNLWSMYQPQLAAYQQGQQANIASLQQQLGLQGLDYNTQRQYQQQQAGYAGQRLDLSSQGQDIQRQALARQLGYLPQEQALANQGFGLQEKQAGTAASSQLRGATSSATVRGALNTQGYGQDIKDIYTQLAYGKEGIGIQRKQSELGFKQQRESIQDQQKNLDLAAKSLGIDRQELATRTDYALNQLGLQNVLSSNDIVRAINDINSGKDSPLWNILPTIYQMTGLRPTAGG